MSEETSETESTSESESTSGSESTATVSWRDSVDDSIKGHPSLADLPDDPMEALLASTKNQIHTKELVGRKGVILPKEGDVADQDRFFNELGRPETPEGYDLSGFTPPEELPWDEGFQTEALKMLHGAGASNDLAVKIMGGYAELLSGQYGTVQETITKGRETAAAELKTELGTNYEPTVALANQAFKAAAGERADAVAGLVLGDGTKLGDHPDFVRLFSSVGKQYSEHGFLGDKGGAGFTKTPETAQQEIAEIEANKALYDEDHPEHALLVSKRNDLYKMAFPGQVEQVG